MSPKYAPTAFDELNRLDSSSAVLKVIDTRKGEVPDSVVHLLEEGAVAPAPGTQVTATLDWEHRHRLMRMHTCMHLLCAVVPGSVTGGQISDGKARLGHISRQGSPALRWALTEAAQKIPTGGGPLRAMFERIAKRRGRKIAKVAVARQILTLCYYGLRDGEIRCLKHQPDIDHHDDELAEAA